MNHQLSERCAVSSILHVTKALAQGTVIPRSHPVFLTMKPFLALFPGFPCILIILRFVFTLWCSTTCPHLLVEECSSHLYALKPYYQLRLDIGVVKLGHDVAVHYFVWKLYIHRILWIALPLCHVICHWWSIFSISHCCGMSCLGSILECLSVCVYVCVCVCVC